MGSVKRKSLGGLVVADTPRSEVRDARREGWTKEEIGKVLKECRAGDYDHLLQTLIACCNDVDVKGDEK